MTANGTPTAPDALSLLGDEALREGERMADAMLASTHVKTQIGTPGAEDEVLRHLMRHAQDRAYCASRRYHRAIDRLNRSGGMDTAVMIEARIKDRIACRTEEKPC